MSAMTDKMTQASDERQQKADPGVGTPKKGERFRCGNCGMEILVTADCYCEDPHHVHFHCCNQELQKV